MGYCNCAGIEKCMYVTSHSDFSRGLILVFGKPLFNVGIDGVFSSAKKKAEMSEKCFLFRGNIIRSNLLCMLSYMLAMMCL